eukprot:8930908-Pyramimonas_sp.AAC.1
MCIRDSTKGGTRPKAHARAMPRRETMRGDRAENDHAGDRAGDHGAPGPPHAEPDDVAPWPPDRHSM